MKVSDFINGPFRDYAIYDNERSLPDLMDGLKVTQRKILFAFIEHIGSQKLGADKAGMRAADVSKYHHGATSMIGALVTMNQDFPGSNNVPLFKKYGQFGTRLSHKASDERYISTQLNDTYKKLFDSDDNKIIEYLYDDGDRIEPKHYLPKLPMLLLNGSSGAANGYSCNILSYKVDDIKKAVQEVLKSGKVKTRLIPYYNGYTGTVTKDEVTGQVAFEGKIERKNTTTLIITELTPSMQLEKYKGILNGLMEKQKNGDSALIKDYDSESNEYGWKFIIDCPRSTSAMSDDELKSMFKLTERVTETLVAWMPNGKLRRFSSVEEMIEVWTHIRLEFYEKRRLNNISILNKDKDFLEVKLSFIEWWNKDSAGLVKLQKKELQQEVSDEFGEDNVDRLLSIRISNLGLGEVEELQKSIDKLFVEIQTLEATTNVKMMTEEVKQIKI